MPGFIAKLVFACARSACVLESGLIEIAGSENNSSNPQKDLSSKSVPAGKFGMHCIHPGARAHASEQSGFHMLVIACPVRSDTTGSWRT